MINFEQQLQNGMVCTYLKSINGCDKDCQKCHRFIEDSEIIAAYHAAIEALEYRTPMKVVYKLDDSSDHTEVVGICPRCHGWEQLYDGEKFCSECGQAIDWE